ncbi:hypothetical protein L2E82_11000 [Cichorium intybus]|uniref:Uncharacterized protein n=1 Tax=Cichorium intybus TaxID=13427 RepID=A0ACB9GE41_CICIN|nr:hypothetical protein L2E82_11000 [Cichorium intybus]
MDGMENESHSAKLFSFIDQTSIPDNPDSLQTQEVFLLGHLVTIYIKEKLQEWLLKSKKLLQDEVNNRKKNFEFGSLADVNKALYKNPTKQVDSTVENMLKTRRLVTQSTLDLKEKDGMTVQAERLNFLRFFVTF